MTDNTGRLELIWLKPKRGGPMERRPRAELSPGGGIAGNEAGRRQVTLISREAWDRASEALGRSVDPSLRRANLLVGGIELERSTGRTLRIGECRIEIGGETRPCARMDAHADGLMAALTPDWRAGAWGRVSTGGAIQVGDPVAWEEGATDSNPG